MKKRKKRKAKLPGNMDVWTVAVGNINPLNPASRAAVKFIAELEGMVAVHPAPPHGTLILFDSKNNAIRGMNLMHSVGIQTGDNICRGRIDGDTVVMGGEA